MRTKAAVATVLEFIAKGKCNNKRISRVFGFGWLSTGQHIMRVRRFDFLNKKRGTITDVFFVKIDKN
jgi:hypothetical protein